MMRHLLATGIRAEQAGALAFSSNKADRMRVDWLSLVAGPSLPILDRHLETFRAEGFAPYEGELGDFLRPGEVGERFD
jgi:peptide/nickel transport system substrate-binding protein